MNFDRKFWLYAFSMEAMTALLPTNQHRNRQEVADEAIYYAKAMLARLERE